MNKSNEELLLHINRLEALLDNLPFEVWLKDEEGNYLFANKQVLESNRLSGPYASIPETASYDKLEKKVYDKSGALLGTGGYYKENETSNKKNGTKLIQIEEQLFRTIFEEAPLGIGIFDCKTEKSISVNVRYADIIGWSKDDILAMSWEQYTHPDDIEENRHRLSLLMENKISSFSMNKRYIRPNGNVIWVNLTVSQIQSKGYDGKYCLCMIEDITSKKKSEEKILYLSYRDQLTGLYNRRFYDEELSRINTSRNLPITIALGDVNGLKLTNDAFGHVFGDNLLKKIASIFQKECRSEDIIARIGGDEFVFIFPKTDYLEAKKILDRITLALQKEQLKNPTCSVSFGLATKQNVKEDIRKIFMKAERNMYHNKLEESKSMRIETIKLIITTLYQKSNREKTHSERVSKLCEMIGNALNMSEEAINELKTAGLLHDIGKIGINGALLNKPGRLTESEWADIKRHPEIGYHILRSVSEFAQIAQYILLHHERVDGKGYPRQMKDEDIPIQSKILSIADAYDTMTNYRSYKQSFSPSEVIDELRKNEGTQFDIEVLNAFIDILKNSENELTITNEGKLE